MKTAKFDPNGGAITAEVTCTPNRPGSYILKLWAADENKKVKEWSGNFINSADDAYDLPGVKANDGRLVEALVTVALGPCTTSLAVSQDGAVLATESVAVPAGGIGLTTDLFVQLEAK